MSRPRLFVALLLALFVWKLVRTDWIVKCRYEYTDADPPPSVSYGVEFYYPPTSPLWDPPTPEKISGRSDATWHNWEFFEGGGSWGPIEEPHLHVHWVLVLGKVLGVGFFLYLLIFGIADLHDEAHGSRRDPSR